MATAKVNGVRPYYELQGNKDILLVLVHGSWGVFSFVPRATAHVDRLHLSSHQDAKTLEIKKRRKAGPYWPFCSDCFSF
jgi:hypothetical protein